MSRPDLEYYCELIAALKLRTTNKAGRHLSTGRAIQLLEEYGVETQQGLVRAPAGVLSVPTVNRWLSLYRLDQPACCGNLRPPGFRRNTAMTAGSLICRLPTSGLRPGSAAPIPGVPPGEGSRAR